VNAELVEALKEWTLKNGRKVTIEFDSLNFEVIPKIKIWVYDYKYMVGKAVGLIEDIPTDSELKAIKKRTIEAQLSQLDSLT